MLVLWVTGTIADNAVLAVAVRATASVTRANIAGNKVVRKPSEFYILYIDNAIYNGIDGQSRSSMYIEFAGDVPTMCHYGIYGNKHALDDYSNPRDTIRMEMGTIDVSVFNCLQQGLFNMACIQCHGGNGRSAANLNLTEGNARNNLVDVPSTKVSDKYRVVSGSAQQSLLHQILNEGGEDILHYNHTEVLSSQFKENLTEIRSLIDEWINKLNPEN